MDRLEQTIRRRLDDDHDTLRFDLGRLATAILERRQEAKKEHGKGSAAEKGWKEAVNWMYGVMACRHLVTNNVVAANVIAGTARALAFAMQMSLNGVQVITDGCTYRADQVPAGTFAGCLAACEEYPINRAGYSGPFLDAGAVPVDTEGFTSWYREHVKRFFGVSAPAYDQLLGLHDLEHKEVEETKQRTFDGLGCDGSANYVKMAKHGDGWKGLDFKARSFKRKAKEQVVRWVIDAYSADFYGGPPPVTAIPSILESKDAGNAARTALLTGR